MAQSFTKEDQLGVALLTQEMLNDGAPLEQRFQHVVQEID